MPMVAAPGNDSNQAFIFEGGRVPGYNALLTAVAMLAWLAGIEVLVAVGWILRLDLLALAPPLSLVMVAAAYRWRLGPVGLAPLLAAFSIGLACLGLALASVDFSADGQGYQMEAMLALLDGWNPLQQVHRDDGGVHALWIDHYAKGPWMIGASLMALTGHLEAGRLQNPLLITACGLLVFYVLRALHGFTVRRACLIALLVAANPVNGYQFFSGYVDAQLGAVLIVLALLCRAYMARPGRLLALALAAALVIAVNIKFSAVVFVLCIVAVFLAYLLLIRAWPVLRGLAGTALLAGGLALLVGYNPFVTNTLDHGHPFFPLAGEQPVSILNGFVTPEFQRKNRFEKLLLSLVSASHHDLAIIMTPTDRQIRPKIPLTVSLDELKVFYKSNGPLIGGFGPWMGGALLLSLLFVARQAAAWRPHRESPELPATVMLLSLLGSVLVFPESWWARYVPQMWGLVVLVVGLLLWCGACRWPWLGRAILLILGLNALLIWLAAAAHQFVQQLDYKAQMGSVRAMSASAPVRIRIVEVLARQRLREWGIVFVESDLAGCPRKDWLIGEGAELCIEPAQQALYLRGSPALAEALGRRL